MPCENSARKRRETIAFRVTPEMKEHIDVLAACAGINKQDYIVAKLTDETITVVPNTRVYKALRTAMRRIYEQLAVSKLGAP